MTYHCKGVWKTYTDISVVVKYGYKMWAAKQEHQSFCEDFEGSVTFKNGSGDYLSLGKNLCDTQGENNQGCLKTP